MLTDIFAYRYRDVRLWDQFEEPARRLLVQGFRIVAEQLFPYYNNNGQVRSGAKELWNSLNKQLAMELGNKDLSPTVYGFYNLQKQWVSGSFTPITVCENFVCADYDEAMPADQFIKERLSFIEIAFRKRGEEIAEINAKLPAAIETARARLARANEAGLALGFNKKDQDPEAGIRADNEQINAAFRASCDELNARFRQANAGLHYHNGFIQVAQDDTIADEIEQPFWDLVSDPKWRNVDHDMKEAVDLRDSDGRDPAWYAARALESVVKIISDEKGWTHGKEKGAAHFLDNLRATKNGSFINDWERESLGLFFSKVRNPLGHGSGQEPISELTGPQTDWAIQFAMIWTLNLIRRM